MHSKTTILTVSLILSIIIVTFILTCGGSLNPFTWETQYQRFTNPRVLIQPEKTASFYVEMIGNGKTNSADPNSMFEYVQEHVHYKNDILTHVALNHLPTTEEVLTTGEDDCDGQAVLLCSLLQYAGYDAHILIGPTHAWVDVATENGSIPIDYMGGDWFVRFNESSIEWKIHVILSFALWEVSGLTAGFSLLFYSHERGILISVLRHTQETLDYLKYAFLVLIGGFCIVLVVLTFWVPGLVAISIGGLLVTELVARLRQ